VLKLGYTGWIFVVDPRVKINEAYYCDLILSQQLLLAIHQVSDEFISLQNSVPAYRVC